MKKILFLLLIVQLSFAQQSANLVKPITTAGDELIKAKKHFYTGSLMCLSGAAFAGMGVATELNGGIIYMGAVVSFVGTILVFESFSHIGKAGIKLNENKTISFTPTKYGATLALHF